MPKPPYKLARLVNSDKPLTERWYILFYVWDSLKAELVRKRDYEVNKYKTRKERLNFAKTAIRELNEALAQGYIINAKQHKEKTALVINHRQDYSIEKAFQAIIPLIKATKRPDTHTSYSSVANLFVEFCKSQDWHTWLIQSLTKEDIISYLDYCQTAKGHKNITRNKYLGFLRAMLTLMKERGIIKENPALGITLLDEDEGRNIAYNDQQISDLKDKMLESNPRLWLYVQFMYYGFIRPKEIGKLTVNMIDWQHNQIVMPASICKNRKTRFVRLSDRFKNVIDQMELHLYRPNDFLFGKNLITGSEPIQKNKASSLHSKIVTDLKYGPDYTLYSWKHTGVVKHYKAGVDIKSIQQQLGHSSLEETDKYLKSLGLLADKAAFDLSPGI